MASFNRVILMGNLTRDPEVRYIASGQAVTELGLAVNRQWTDRNTNERKEEVTFVDVTLWGRTAEVAGEYLSKGRPVMIEGRLQLDQWEDRESGQKRSKLRVVGESMTMLPSGGSGSGGGAPQTAPPAQKPNYNSAPQQAAPAATPEKSPDQAFYDQSSSSTNDEDVPF